MFSFQTPIYSTRAWIKTTTQSISHILIYNFPSVDNHHWDCSGLLFGYIQSEHLQVSKYIKALTSVWPLQPLHTAVMRGRLRPPRLHFVWCACRKCPRSWGCIGDYSVEDSQRSDGPPAEALQDYMTLQLRPTLWFKTLDQPEEHTKHSTKSKTFFRLTGFSFVFDHLGIAGFLVSHNAV